VTLCKNNACTQEDDKSEIKNYQPIASLCSTSKIFEKIVKEKYY
jgi:hypothetical protein